MNKIKLSLLASTITLSTTLYADDSSSIEEAFKKGKASGELSLYTKHNDNSGTTKDSGYSLGNITLGYKTAVYNNFKAAIGFMANGEISEKEKGDYKSTSSDPNAPEAILNIANINYSNDFLSLTVGRQEIDLEWMTDYHEAVVAAITAIPNTTVVLGYTDKVTDSENDEALRGFSDIGTNGDGAYVADVTVTPNDMFLINGYYMDAPDTFDATGGKLGFTMDGIEATLKYASTNEDVQGTKDGNIMAIDLGYSNDLFGINGGYIKTDKDGGIGSLDALGDNINPLDSGNQVYSPDAKTYYVGANTTLAGFDLGAIYGSTKYDNSGTQEKEKEFNFTVDKEIFTNTTLSLLYADIDAHTSTDDSRYYFAQVVYSF